MAGPHQVIGNGKDKLGRFLPGRQGGPGRPVGSRNRLSEKFLSDLQKVWLKKGAKALDKVADENPETLVRVVASLLPREMLASVSVNTNVDVNLAADVQTFAQAYRAWGAFIGAKGLPLIETEAVEQDVVEVENEPG